MTTDTSTGRQKADQAKEEGRQLADEARTRAEEVGRQAKQEMRNVVDEARFRARDQADDQTHRAAGALRDMAHQLRSMADGAEARGSMTDLAHNGADRIGRFADHLDEGGIDGIVDDVQNFARRRPGLFLGAALGAGMLLGRVLRASDTGALKQAISQEGEATASERGGSGEELRARSEPLAPGQVVAPVTTGPEAPGAGRGI